MARKNVNIPHDRSREPRINVTAAAERLECSVSWVYKLVAAGELQAYRIGSRKGVQITVRSVNDYLASRKI